MSTLIGASPEVQATVKSPAPSASLFAPPADPREAPGAACCPPLSTQIADLLKRHGATRTDIIVFVSIYALILLLMTGLALASRAGHSAAWAWGMRIVDVPLIAAGCGLLLLACAAGALALRFAAASRRGATVAALIVAAGACLGFGATILIDLDNNAHNGVRPGEAFKPKDRAMARAYGVRLPKRAANNAPAVPVAAAVPAQRLVSAAHGREIFVGTCVTCHGPHGEGLPGQGKSLIDNEFVSSCDDAKLLKFLQVGRQPWEPENTTKVQMPPRGGNPMLTDADLRDVAAYLRTLHAEDPPGGATSSATPAAAPAASPSEGAAAIPESAAAHGSAAANPGATPAPGGATTRAAEPFFVHRWVVSPPPPTAAQVTPSAVAEITRPQWKAPADGAAFASAYFLTAQFGVGHAGAVALAFIVLIVLVLRGQITPAQRAPLALGVAACCGLAAFWLVVFPLAFLV